MTNKYTNDKLVINTTQNKDTDKFTHESVVMIADTPYGFETTVKLVDGGYLKVYHKDIDVLIDSSSLHVKRADWRLDPFLTYDKFKDLSFKLNDKETYTYAFKHKQ